MNMKEKTACFTGHRNITDPFGTLRRKLKKAIIECIDNGIIYYGCGGALGFDTMAALSIIKLKRKYPQIKLIMVLPCHGQDSPWSESDKAHYRDILQQADKVKYLADAYCKGCMHDRNRKLVEGSSVCIAYLKKQKGGTAYTVEHARENGLRIINLATHP